MADNDDEAMADPDPEENPFNTTMKFVSGGDTNVFTKTPANVTRDYFDGPAPTPKSQAQARTTTTSKKRKTTATTTVDTTTDPSSSSPAPKKLKTSNNNSGGSLSLRPKQSRKHKGRATIARPIPRNWEECDAADKMLVEWRDEEKEWAPIKAEWKRLTGEQPAQSTLPNRYARLKMNFAILNEEDNAMLLQAKREIEDAFQAQKWSLVAAKLLAKGGSDHTSCPMILQRQWKKLMLGGGAALPVGMEDPDLEGSE